LFKFSLEFETAILSTVLSKHHFKQYNMTFDFSRIIWCLYSTKCCATIFS